jgi:ribonuclease M5
MLSYSTKAVIVVEGKNDTAAIHSFLDCTTIETRGMDIDGALPEIREAAKTAQVVVLTDTDPSGERIRAYIHAQIEGCLDARVSSPNGKRRAQVERVDSKEIFRALRESGAQIDIHLPILYGKTDKGD